MTKTKKIIAVAAITLAGTFGAAGVASAHDNNHHNHDHGLVNGLLHVVGHVLRDL